MMVTFLLFLNFLLMIIMPILLGWLIASRRHVGWRLFGIGAVGFFVSQLFHIPFNWLVLQKYQLIPVDNLIVLVLFLGLSAGVFEESTRYLFYRFWITDARSWGKGLMFGAGWGGFEAILLGVIGLLNFTILLGMRNGYFLEMVPADQMNLIEETIQAMFGVPLNVALLGAVERLFALCFHLAASLMVMQVFVRKNILWLGAAILWHTLLNATAVYANAIWGAVPAEGLLGLMAMLSLGIIFWLKAPEPVAPEPEPLPAVGPANPVEVDLSSSSLEESKYS